ncbi:TetR/AcrR family transcriptional regulator [Croceicoccus marinus]|uniref:TetR family transcriptional regulator n=1 Tax=Croceicoccus marinus TaxID=450378 RepID=A0A1Z1F8D6_9SPHN|nr:TetR/AcrR family transcriptional regulator [Croceicoccus marinus]ARU15006.1 TetR family transcriptional regulator [Croceicoccus marinus]
MNNSSRSRSADAQHLGIDDWTEAALKALAVNGIDGVRVEILAKSLGVTKGSFYWHFKDRDALHKAMLDHWRRRSTLSLIERLDSSDQTPKIRLRRLLRVPFTASRSRSAADVELAIRMWGRRDRRAQDALEEVDSLRLRYIAGLLEACGFSRDMAEERAVLAYCYMRVGATLIEADATDLLERCETLLIEPDQAAASA